MDETLKAKKREKSRDYQEKNREEILRRKKELRLKKKMEENKDYKPRAPRVPMKPKPNRVQPEEDRFMRGQYERLMNEQREMMAKDRQMCPGQFCVLMMCPMVDFDTMIENAVKKHSTAVNHVDLSE